MTFLANDPKHFAADSLHGMVAANPRHLQAVHGGVVRATASPEGEVSIVVGGGSGHYPAFAGWVGPGLAHGAVCGNIFASPSESQVKSVTKAADNGGGSLLLFGNYAGDCLHFGAAAEALSVDGNRVVCLPISDDIASNSPENHTDRRGIAGDLMVVKVAGAAAAKGMRLDEVIRIATDANEATRSLGVAFTGCTLPGADHPLFTVPDGEFALGLGIHGEPGISTHAMMPARDIAALLIDKILAEEPQHTPGGYDGRVAVLVNGLGATKYEELFVLFGAVADLLTQRGLTMVAPVVDEQVTSLDMAGVSLTLMFLTPELEELWLTPADSPAFKTGTIEASTTPRRVVVEEEQTPQIVAGSPESAAQAAHAAALLDLLAETSSAKEEELGTLDSIAGDGDHGQGMTLGATAAARAARDAVAKGAGMATLFRVAGEAWSEGAGGTSGRLWGAALCGLGDALDDTVAADEPTLLAAATAGANAFATIGGAQVGDKTMVDATVPFAQALADAEGRPLAEAWTAAAAAATKGAASTADIVARKGRARTHGEKSLGHPDPGAVSFALLMTAVAERLTTDHH